MRVSALAQKVVSSAESALPVADLSLGEQIVRDLIPQIEAGLDHIPTAEKLEPIIAEHGGLEALKETLRRQSCCPDLPTVTAFVELTQRLFAALEALGDRNFLSVPIRSQEGFIKQLEINPAGDRIFVETLDDQGSRYLELTGDAGTILEAGSDCRFSARFSPLIDGSQASRRAFVELHEGIQCRLFDLDAGCFFAVDGRTADEAKIVHWLPSGEPLISARFDGAWHLYDGSGGEISTPKMRGGLPHVVWDLYGSESKVVEVFDGDTQLRLFKGIGAGSFSQITSHSRDTVESSLVSTNSSFSYSIITTSDSSRLLDLERDKIVHAVEGVPINPSEIQLSPDMINGYATSLHDGEYRLIDLRSLTFVRCGEQLFRPDGQPEFSASGRLGFVRGDVGGVPGILDLSSRVFLECRAPSSDRTHIYFSSDEKRALVHVVSESGHCMRDLVSGETFEALRPEDSLEMSKDIEFTSIPDVAYLSGRWNGGAGVYEIFSRRWISVQGDGEWEMPQIAASPDGARAHASVRRSSSGTTNYIFDLSDNRIVAEGTWNFSGCIFYSGDSTRAFAFVYPATFSMEARIFDLDSGEFLEPPGMIEAEMGMPRFLADGSIISAAQCEQSGKIGVYSLTGNFISDMYRDAARVKRTLS